MRKAAVLILAGLTSVALAAERKKDATPAPVDKKTPREASLDPKTGEGPTEDAAADSEAANEDEKKPSRDDALFAELEKAAAEAAKTEKERLAKVAAARKAARGEKHEVFKTRKGRIFRRVTIKGVDDLGVRIVHEAGTARIKFEELPDDYQKRFGYDPTKASKQLDKEKSVEFDRERRALARLRAESGKKIGKPIRKPVSAPPDRPSSKTETEDPPSETEPVDGAPSVAQLEAKIETLQAGIKQIKVVVKDFEKKASKIENSVFRKNIGEGRQGVGREPTLNKKKLAEAKEWRAKAGDEIDKIAAARRLISKHRKQIKKLEEGK